MGIRLITGNTLETKVQAEDDRALNAGIVRKNECVFSVGSKFEHEILTANTIRIKDGDGIMYGAHFRIPKGEFEDVQIETCPVGLKRIDVICAKYKKYQNTESCSIEVVKGIEKSKDPLVPIIQKGNILNGDAENLMPLKIVTLDGVNIMSVVDAFVLNDELKILWQGAFFMHGEQVINLAEKIDSQKNGIVVVWSNYDSKNSKPKDYNWHYYFVPKSHVQNLNGQGVSFSDAYEKLNKYLYINNDSIKGFTENDKEGTRNGIAFNNKNHVLRYIIGV